jgi:integrase
MPRLTVAYVNGVSTDKDTIIADDVLPGFALKVRASGRKTYVYRYRIGGRQSTFTIGPAEAFTPAQAREEAKKKAGDVAKGIDPNDSKRAARAMPTIREYAALYVEHSTNVSLRDDQAKLSKVLLPRWGSRPLDGLRQSDIRQLLKSLSQGGRSPATVNRYRSLLSALFNRAVSDGILAKNPVSGIKPLPELNERTRWLEGDELARFLAALNETPQNARNCILVMLLTGIRRGNVMRMRWDEISDTGGHLLWTIPRTKAQTKQVVPLNPEVVRVLEAQKVLREVSNPYVFPGRHKGQPLSTVQQAWSNTIKKANILDIRLHDLRHTYASHLVAGGVPLFNVSKLLGHSSTAMTQRYAHLANDALQTAARIGAESILKGIK